MSLKSVNPPKFQKLQSEKELRIRKTFRRWRWIEENLIWNNLRYSMFLMIWFIWSLNVGMVSKRVSHTKLLSAEKYSWTIKLRIDFAPRQSMSGNFCLISSSIWETASPMTMKFFNTAHLAWANRLRILLLK